MCVGGNYDIIENNLPSKSISQGGASESRLFRLQEPDSKHIGVVKSKASTVYAEYGKVNVYVTFDIQERVISLIGVVDN